MRAASLRGRSARVAKRTSWGTARESRSRERHGYAAGSDPRRRRVVSPPESILPGDTLGGNTVFVRTGAVVAKQNGCASRATGGHWRERGRNGFSGRGPCPAVRTSAGRWGVSIIRGPPFRPSHFALGAKVCHPRLSTAQTSRQGTERRLQPAYMFV